MKLAPLHLVAYEHQRVRLAAEPLRRLLHLQEQRGAAWFTGGYQCLQLSSYVGVIQLPGLTLEILPKADSPAHGGSGEGPWRRVLLQLLQRVYELPVAVPTAAQLAQAPHAMLDLFIAAFVQAADTLLQQGLVKRYHPAEANRPALKGQLLFAQHLRENLTHGERFFTRAQVYDQCHPLNCLLRMALVTAAAVARAPTLAARARTLLAHWPELPEVLVPAEPPALGRRTAPYRRALDLALLLLGGHSPALHRGSTQALALLFDMNRLFELYVAKQLRQAAGSKVRVLLQNHQPFWGKVHIRPDILVQAGDSCFVLDTKWKIPKHHNPAAADLQQLYAYCHLWNAPHGLLVYPSTSSLQLPRQLDFSESQLMPGRVLTGHVYLAAVIDSDGLNLLLGQQLWAYLQKLPKPSATNTNALSA